MAFFFWYEYNGADFVAIFCIDSTFTNQCRPSISNSYYALYPVVQCKYFLASILLIRDKTQTWLKIWSKYKLVMLDAYYQTSAQSSQSRVSVMYPFRKVSLASIVSTYTICYTIHLQCRNLLFKTPMKTSSCWELILSKCIFLHSLYEDMICDLFIDLIYFSHKLYFIMVNSWSENSGHS